MQVAHKNVAICAAKPRGDVCLLVLNCRYCISMYSNSVFSVSQQKAQEKQVCAARGTAVCSQGNMYVDSGGTEGEMDALAACLCTNCTQIFI